MRKRLASLLFAALCLTLFTPTCAMEGPTKTYSAQVRYASHVDEYGSNIQEALQAQPAMPVTITQAAGSLQIELVLEDTPITLNATPRGTNKNGNMVYFDPEESEFDTFRVLTLAYIEDFTHSAVLARDYCEAHPEVENVLELYFKVENADVREYYFIEIFDFVLEDFSELAPETCKADYWITKEFQPVTCTQSEDPFGITPYKDYTKLHTFTHTYKFGAIYNMVASLTVSALESIPSSLPKGLSQEWKFRLKIERQSTVCEDAPEYDGDDSVIMLAGISFAMTTPLNCAIRSTELTGQVKNLNAFSGLFSASISVALGPVSLSVNLSDISKNLGTVSLGYPYTLYDNSDPDHRHIAEQLDFSNSHYLSDTGDYICVLIDVCDYGEVETVTNYATCKWILTAKNENTGEIISSGYALGSSIACQVT